MFSFIYFESMFFSEQKFNNFWLLERSTKTTIKKGKNGHFITTSLDHHLIFSSWRYGPTTCCLGHIYSRRYKSPSIVESCCARAMWWRSSHPFFLMTSYLFISFFQNLMLTSCFPCSIKFNTLNFLGPHCTMNIEH
jgi:hypothetical protein